MSAPAVKNSRRVDNVIPPQAAHSSIAKLPPLHPNKSQPKRNSSNRLIQDQNVNRNDELKIGDFEVCSLFYSNELKALMSLSVSLKMKYLLLDDR